MQQIQPAVGVDIQAMVNSVTPIIGLGMMSMVMGTMTKALA